MSKLSRAVRAKRYLVKKNSEVRLVLENKLGEATELLVVDCSSEGIRAEMQRSPSSDDGFVENEIVPSSKLLWSDKEFSLGRLVLRRFVEKDGRAEMSFSVVDIKVPISGSLSKFLDIDLERNATEDQRELSANKFSMANFVENEYSNIDLFDRIREFSVFARDWLRSPKWGYYVSRVASKGSRLNLARLRSGGRNDYIMMASNDYLGLGAHPEVIEAAKKALDLYGFGSTGSPLSTGTTDLHTKLCTEIAKMHGKESAILFNSGYAVNVGVIPALTTAGDLIVADQLCHASLQDGMQMSKATSRFFKHNNAEHLRQLLQKERLQYNGCLLITEGVFSMDGDVACLDQIYEVAREFNCRILVDQAHDWGVVGPSALGVCDKFNLMREIDIIMGTFSKIGGGIGGFVVGSQELTQWLGVFARSHVFSVSLPPSNVAAALKAIELFQNDKSHVENLRRNIKHFVKGLRRIGLAIDEAHESAVVPVVIGDDQVMGGMYQSLMDDGIWCMPVVYPVVSRTNCRFRFTVMATHSITDLDYAIICLEKAAMKTGFSFSDKSNKTKKAA